MNTSVVYHGPITRPHLAVDHPGVLGEAAGNNEVGVLDGSRSRYGIRLRNLKHHVGLDVPAFVPLDRCGSVLRIAFRSACVSPCRKLAHIRIAQAAIIGKVTIFGIGKPGWHFARDHRRFYGFSPWTRAVVVEKRRRSDLPRPMAALAILLQNGQYVFVKRHVCGQRDAPGVCPSNESHDQISPHDPNLSTQIVGEKRSGWGTKSLEICFRIPMKVDREPDGLRAENARLTRSLAEKEVLIQELHHRAKNNLQIIASLLRLQAKAASHEMVTALLQQSQYRLEAMAMIHEQLYGSADFRHVQLAQQANLLMTNLFSAYGVDPARITGKAVICPRPDGTPLVLGVDQAIPIGLILNELISNALKHAFPDGRSGTIRIEAQSQDSLVNLAVVDDGVGMAEDLDARGRKSLGLEIVEILARQLRGTWKLQREAGTVFRLSFPER